MVGVLDAFEIERAHVIGASMGGMIGQALAIEHPQRVLSLTSMISSPSCVPGTPGSGLPPPAPEVLASAGGPPPRTREGRIAARLTLARILTGTIAPFDETATRALVEREYERARAWDAQFNHGLAIGTSSDRSEALSRVAVPALVVHGTEDRLLPYPHGVATAECIPEARLLTIEGMGHELPEIVWPTLVEAIVEHTAGVAR